MIRTQVSLSKDEYQLAKETARKMGISLAELLRRALHLLFPAGVKPHAAAKKWLRYEGLVASENPKSSQEIDDVIYGQKD